MAIAVAATYLDERQILTGALIDSAKLVVTGLASGNNSVPHGLVRAPRKVQIEPTSSAVIYEYQAADAINIYLNASAASSGCTIYVEY
jgi:hypothetical protein